MTAPSKLDEARLREVADYETVSQALSYNPESGVLTWKVRKGMRVKPGMRAGSRNPDGSRKIKINERCYPEHRVCWLLAHGRWPAQLVDHFNGDPSDNRLANLREANPQQNSANSRINANNTTGYKGVGRYLSGGRFYARIRHMGVVRHLGIFDTAGEAHAAYAAAAIRLHGDFHNLGTHRAVEGRRAHD